MTIDKQCIVCYYLYMIHENIKTTLTNITEGLTATNEAEILPIYYGNELVNGAAYAAYRFKRFMNAAPERLGHVATLTAKAATMVVSHMSAEYPEW